MNELIEENYASIVRRGLITHNTTASDFIMKMKEEVEELIEANKFNMKNEAEELADVILVCLNYAKHFNIDIEKKLKQKIQTNKTR